MRSRSTDGQNGFTLIELVVAFTILSLVTVAAFGGLGVSLSSWTRGNDAIDRLRTEHAGVELMRAQLQAALPFASPGGAIVFRGSSSEMEFVSANSVIDGPGGVPRWIRWVRQPGPAAGSLQVSERRVLSPGNQPEAEAYWTGALIDGDLTGFRYFRQGGAGGAEGWFESWDAGATGELPAAVAILAGEPARSWIVPVDSSDASRIGARLE
jgi:prepilin-type N-terminal cleavage/methylation domain-containing protein